MSSMEQSELSDDLSEEMRASKPSAQERHISNSVALEIRHSSQIRRSADFVASTERVPVCVADRKCEQQNSCSPESNVVEALECNQNPDGHGQQNNNSEVCDDVATEFGKPDFANAQADVLEDLAETFPSAGKCLNASVSDGCVRNVEGELANATSTDRNKNRTEPRNIASFTDFSSRSQAIVPDYKLHSKSSDGCKTHCGGDVENTQNDTGAEDDGIHGQCKLESTAREVENGDDCVHNNIPDCAAPGVYSSTDTQAPRVEMVNDVPTHADHGDRSCIDGGLQNDQYDHNHICEHLQVDGYRGCNQIEHCHCDESDSNPIHEGIDVANSCEVGLAIGEDGVVQHVPCCRHHPDYDSSYYASHDVARYHDEHFHDHADIPLHDHASCRIDDSAHLHCVYDDPLHHIHHHVQDHICLDQKDSGHSHPQHIQCESNSNELSCDHAHADGRLYGHECSLAPHDRNCENINSLIPRAYRIDEKESVSGSGDLQQDKPAKNVGKRCCEIMNGHHFDAHSPTNGQSNCPSFSGTTRHDAVRDQSTFGVNDNSPCPALSPAENGPCCRPANAVTFVESDRVPDRDDCMLATEQPSVLPATDKPSRSEINGAAVQHFACCTTDMVQDHLRKKNLPSSETVNSALETAASADSERDESANNPKDMSLLRQRELELSHPSLGTESNNNLSDLTSVNVQQSLSIGQAHAFLQRPISYPSSSGARSASSVPASESTCVEQAKLAFAKFVPSISGPGSNGNSELLTPPRARSLSVQKRGESISLARKAAAGAKRRREEALERQRYETLQRHALSDGEARIKHSETSNDDCDGPSVATGRTSDSIVNCQSGVTVSSNLVDRGDLHHGDPFATGMCTPSHAPDYVLKADAFKESASTRANVSQTKEKRAQRVKWRPEEITALHKGVEKHGAGRWAVILREFAEDFDPVRISVDLKDKWRNLAKAPKPQSRISLEADMSPLAKRVKTELPTSCELICNSSGKVASLEYSLLGTGDSACYCASSRKLEPKIGEQSRCCSLEMKRSDLSEAAAGLIVAQASPSKQEPQFSSDDDSCRHDATCFNSDTKTETERRINPGNGMNSVESSDDCSARARMTDSDEEKRDNGSAGQEVNSFSKDFVADSYVNISPVESSELFPDTRKLSKDLDLEAVVTSVVGEEPDGDFSDILRSRGEASKQVSGLKSSSDTAVGNDTVSQPCPLARNINGTSPAELSKQSRQFSLGMCLHNSETAHCANDAARCIGTGASRTLVNSSSRSNIRKETDVKLGAKPLWRPIERKLSEERLDTNCDIRHSSVVQRVRACNDSVLQVRDRTSELGNTCPPVPHSPSDRDARTHVEIRDRVSETLAH